MAQEPLRSAVKPGVLIADAAGVRPRFRPRLLEHEAAVVAMPGGPGAIGLSTARPVRISRAEPGRMVGDSLTDVRVEVAMHLLSTTGESRAERGPLSGRPPVSPGTKPPRNYLARRGSVRLTGG